MQVVASLLLGLLFGLGILVSGMGNPAKILNFFDVFGAWDPSLAFVMAGGLLVNVIGYRLAFSRPHPVLADKFSLPDRSVIDVPLIAGSALFGVGWGLVGFCPGGLIPVLALGRREPVIFLLGLLAGIWAARVVMNATARARIAPLGRGGSP